MNLSWILFGCMVPTFSQGVAFSLPLLISGLILRLLIRIWKHINLLAVNILASLMGFGVLWWYYSGGVVYFVVLCGIVYGELVFVRRYRGILIGFTSVIFIIICEGLVVSTTDWHQIRGSFLVMVMKMVSLGFDVESWKNIHGEKQHPSVLITPNVAEYISYCIFPSTTVFGPFLTYNQHKKFLSPSPLNFVWIVRVVQAWISSMLCLCVSVCVMPFIFSEPHWNKWLAAYCAAASFRYSHYFVSFLSQFGTLVAGIGYTNKDLQSSCNKSIFCRTKFRVVNPLSIELPRSIGMVVINWNVPMHLFLKEYVFKPSLSYIGRFGAILLTYFASAMLHGLNFQLASVLLSIGIYAYIENVLRLKLSQKLDACVLDRPCPTECKHRNKKGSGMVMVINIVFMLLSLFHLAYLGVMFGVQSEDDGSLQVEGYSFYHTLRKWAHLDFLSHWIVLLTYVISLTL